MFGDDPDPTVTTARVGFRTTFGRVRGVWQKAMETRGFDGLRKEREESGPVDLRGVNRDKEEAATMSECKFYENDADAMRMMWWDEMQDMNKMQNKRQKPNHKVNTISHGRNRQELKLQLWKDTFGVLHVMSVFGNVICDTFSLEAEPYRSTSVELSWE